MRIAMGWLGMGCLSPTLPLADTDPLVAPDEDADADTEVDADVDTDIDTDVDTDSDVDTDVGGAFLSVSLIWGAPVDLDLHLLQPNAEPFSDGDCYPDNCERDWGVAHNPSDDPFHSGDARSGGFELVSIPAAAPGTYGIWVYTNADLPDGTIDFSVEIQVDGTVSVLERTIWDQPGGFVVVGTVTVPGTD